MNKPIIAIDIDDVLSLSAQGFAAYSNQTWNSGITAEDYCEEWAVTWGVSHEVAAKRALEFHGAGVVGKYTRVPGSKEALKELSKRFDLVAVTSRRQSLKPETTVWFGVHFPGVFKDVIYAGIWDKDSAKTIHANLAATKTDICVNIGAKFIIDDQIKHCESAATKGIRAILFGDFTWNRSDKELHKGIIRRANWPEVIEYFNASR